MKPDVRLLFFFLLSLFPCLTSGYSSSGKRTCEPITVPMCAGMQYSKTAMPNHFGHTNQDDAKMEISQFVALTRVNCSKELPVRKKS